MHTTFFLSRAHTHCAKCVLTAHTLCAPQAQKSAANNAAKQQEKDRKLAAQQEQAQQQRMGDVMKNVFGTSGGFKPKIKIKVSNPSAAGGAPTRGGGAATRSAMPPPAGEQQLVLALLPVQAGSYEHLELRPLQKCHTPIHAYP